MLGGLLGDLAQSLFVPSEERITALTDSVSSKFDFIDTIQDSINSMVDVINGVSNTPQLNIKLGSTKYTDETTVTIDFSWYAPFKAYGDLIITGFAYAMFVWRLFIKLPGIISGSSGTTNIGKENVK